MIVLFIVAMALCAFIGWKAAEVGINLYQQFVMNGWRKELDLPLKPYSIRV